MLGIFIFLTDFSYGRLRSDRVIKNIISSKSHRYGGCVLISNIGSKKIGVTSPWLSKLFRKREVISTKNLLLVPKVLLEKCSEILVFYDYDLPISNILRELRESVNGEQRLQLYRILDNGKVVKTYSR